MSVDNSSLDTRSIRKEALLMLRTGEAINKTIKLAMRTKMQTSPCKKVSVDINPSSFHADQNTSKFKDGAGSPVSTPNLDHETLNQRGISSAHPPTAKSLVEPSASTLNLKGNVVPVHYFKDAMVDVFRKEKTTKRQPKNVVAENSLYLSDDISAASRNEFNDSWSSALPPPLDQKSQFMQDTQSMMVSRLANPREENSYTWKRMKKLRDERNATLERRKARENMIYNFKRVVLNTDQNEFHRAYREQYAQQEHVVKKKHADRTHERKILDENLNRKVAAKQKQQQDEAAYMRRVLRESADRSRAVLNEEIAFNKMNKELSGVVGRSQSNLDICSSSMIQVPQHLQSKLKTAKSLEAFEAAQRDIKLFYETSMSERIALYAKSRERAITRASEIDHPISLSPILGADLFSDSVPSTASYKDDYERYLHYSHHLRPLQPEPPRFNADTPRRPSTSDIALQEYFASRVSQQELFELENFSLHSQDDVSLVHGSNQYH